jgi:hypothetical protein
VVIARQQPVNCNIKMGFTVWVLRFISLPPHIKRELHNPRKFETCLKHFLHAHYFYSLKEYFNVKPT